ncbi:alcohol dehydrogenase catalytic domain-containing protein [Altererythrobacter xixiisoli]|uniref:Alcohol dehydrogenase catalytic domain-containing protein n=1 Tax=Croceibacterium xixiisoli TaxID=1476466 RepID=A0A6I4U056_9SPHN|nr:L-idonate 5-dehydrogenase [Croceibacterium xixiisoli]MXP00712.1 alcohol dehydrogenase catalytic domain-containing protein [Croceibacterium xixiisoli]
MQAAICHGAKDLRIEHCTDAPLAADEVRVAVAYGGICGSDMHYFHRGAVGDFALREPMVLGHEISGRVLEWGSAVSGLTVGQKAALNPSRACLHCDWCRAGRSNLCADMRFLGSAGRFPHVQGGFAEHLVLRADQVIPVPENTDLLALSVAEPLSVALHAVKRAGELLGRRVIVTGSGPIGLLTARCALLAGAVHVVCTDIEDAALAVAKDRIGVAETLNVRSDPDGLARYRADDQAFDIAFEASGSPSALHSLFPVMRRGGRIVQLGMMPPGEVSLPINQLQTREIDLVGAFRAHDEFALAAQLIMTGQIDVSPILSGTYPLADAISAFEQAGDRSRVVKLHIAIAKQE